LEDMPSNTRRRSGSHPVSWHFIFRVVHVVSCNI
jgi:hypothetical protein